MDIRDLEAILDKDGIVFLTYSGFITQSLIVGMTEALEKETEQSDLNINIANNIFTIFIELSQNIMSYSKSRKKIDERFDPKGLIVVGKNKEGCYYVYSQNILDKNDKEKILPKLQEIDSMDNEAIKVRYRELRRSGRDRHHKGAGIGFYEIAKRCSSIEYSFESINEERYLFKFMAMVKQ